MRFADIPAREDVKKRLRDMVDNRHLPHALLLEGPPGSGKFALARALAQYIHCENRLPNGDSCGRCPSCLQHSTFNHIDTIYSFPILKKDSKKAAVSADYLSEFKELLEENPFMDFESWLLKLDNINSQPRIYVDEATELGRQLSYTAHASEYKIVLMWLPERMNEDAANKLLKLVEEPFPDTIFIMASDNPRAILPTIYSRTQRVSVMRYSDSEVAEYLCSSHNLSAEDAHQVARLAAGNMLEAVKLISVSKDRELYLKLFIELMRKAYMRSVAELKMWAADVADLGREREMQFLDFCARMIRENFILNIRTPELNSLSGPELQFSQKFSPFINERNVLKIFSHINDARADIAANANAKLVNFDLAIKTILLLKA